MSSARRQTLTLPSVLDRLLDDRPSEPEVAGAMLFEVADFKRSLARDLEALLNTRTLEHEELFDAHPLAGETVINFGIPDLSGLSLLNPDDRELLRERVRKAIDRHEPRLSRVRVSLDLPREGERLLRFRVDGVLKIHPHRPPVSFDATLQLSSNAYKVRGDL
ncbi:type VI secretion system baseplate subunit TssE [Andreprevotia chitinilytica]|uniref:type VI secretion system baseplate subunit TssE n=1 Tax=Andreprevotia chitinilytica TaxID=396808 RepID=UPI00055991CC|nr:type VI secretion system baseplate subunit TssE [Andreprevotia chitinilytica]